MGKFDKYTKEELLKIVEKQEKELKTKKYGLVWDSEKEPEQVVLDCENNIPILQRIKEKEIITDDSDDNILIEGDNYHALTCLNYTHKGKIDLIYIDPPYNTGKSDEWKYNDKYVDENDGYRHSKWLNFIEKRLLLAFNLLKDNGVIFISIDDNEIFNLKLICDRIFKEDNFVANLIWEKVRIRKNSALYFTENHDYILTIAKKKQKKPNDNGWVRNLLDRANNNYSNPDNDPNGPWIRGSVTANNPYSVEYTINKPNGIILKRPENAYWRYSEESFKKFIEEDRVLWGEGNSYPMIKKYLKDAKDGLVPKSILGFFEYGGNPDGANEIKEIFNGKKVFTNSKPSKLISKLINFHTNKNAVILDFFAGSGTTGHAVLQLNKQDGGNRKFILCTNNENKICEEVTYPRIRNVIKGYKFKGKDKTSLFEQKLTYSQLKKIETINDEIDRTIDENKAKFDSIEKKFEDSTIKITGIKNIDGFKEGLNGNLQYFRTDLIPVERIDKISDTQRHELTEKAGQMIAIKENTFEEVETNEWYQIFENKDKTRKTAIYFRENMEKFDNLINKIGTTQSTLYIFSYSRIDKNLFSNLSKRIIIEDIPEPIIEIYKEINLTLKDK